MFYRMTGQDIRDIIHSLYYALCKIFEKNQDAEIHLIGFSRGAFTVRCLACLIEDIGLIRSFYLEKIYDDVYEFWESGNKTSMQNWIDDGREYSAIHPVKIVSCGVWDTVSALRLPSTLSFVNDRVPSNLDFAFQALALHEQRQRYEPVLWNQEQDRYTCIRQCWFAGDHSDIGGGWPDGGLANLTLIWMLARYQERFPGIFIDCEALYRLCCPPGIDWPCLSHTLSQGMCHEAVRKTGDKVLTLIYRQCKPL
ncbi:uncharacterized protein J4E79_005019 [Alternaria viburni]|uniref:uncharacterized protein n=1 Tax=Alternaria viburni TaxID=566460 RepID=UPI0020C1FB20|nr:uncharacterized protein J4E79_005019 [Alternaria viburni]KAI4661207.1 hypothetical protein J4E79_005019 [Alternaria viburni]